MTAKRTRQERKPAQPNQRIKNWNGTARSSDPYAPTVTQRQEMERLSPFQNGDATPKRPKTLQRLKSNRLIGVVSSKTHMFKVAIPCYHWARTDGSCRLECEAWVEAGGVPQSGKQRKPLHMQAKP
jgi:hypothetical protein